MNLKTTLNDEDIRQIAKLHYCSLGDGFLASFGENFLYLLYQQIYAAEGSIIIVSHNKSQVNGFIAGGISLKNIYFKLLRHPIRLCKAILRNLIVSDNLVRLFSILFRKNNNVIKTSKAELYAICVLEEFHGLGLGTKLYNELCTYFEKHDIDDFVITVGATLPKAQNFYIKQGASLIGAIDQGKGKCSLIFRQVL